MLFHTVICQSTQLLWHFRHIATLYIFKTKAITVFITTVRFASAVLAVPVARYLSVSVASRCSDETDWRIKLLLAWRFPLTYPILLCKEIWVSPKIMVLLSETLSPTLNLLNFATATCCRFSSTKVDAQCDKLGPLLVELSWQYLRRLTFDRRPWPVYHSERPSACTA